MKQLATMTLVALCLSIAPAFSASAADGYEISNDVIYGHKAGMALTFDVVQPTENANGVGILFMVSGGWVSRYFDLEQAMRDPDGGRFGHLVDRGFTLFMVRHGSSPYFKVPSAVEDVRRGLRYIRHHAADFGVDPDRLGVFGGSAGGHLSLMLGNTSDEGLTNSEDPIERTPAKVAAVVAYFPPVDLRGLAGPNDRFPALDFPEDETAAISPILFVSKDDPPTLLVHGDQDTLVPLDHSERILAAFNDVSVTSELIVIEGAGHGFQGADGVRAASALAEWFEQHLVQAHTD